MSDRDFYTEVIDLAAVWQQIVEDGSPGDAPDNAVDTILAGVVRKIVQVAEETNPGDYHTEVFNIVQH